MRCLREALEPQTLRVPFANGISVVFVIDDGG